MTYVNLNVKSCFSFMESCIKLDNYIEYAKEKKLKILALTDINMHAAYKFYKLCIKENIKPIIGLIVNVKMENFDEFKIILYAKNSTGYHSLLKISSLAHDSKEKILRFDQIEEYASNLIAITYPNLRESKYINEVLLNKDLKSVQLEKMKDLFKDDFYVSIQLVADNEKIFTGHEIKEYCIKNNISCIVSNEINYLHVEDTETVDYLEAVRTRAKRIQSQSLETFLTVDSEAYAEIKKEYELELKLTNAIAEKIHLELYMEKPKIEYLQSELRGVTSDVFLQELCIKGLEKRFYTERIAEEKISEYQKRLKYELGVILNMGYSDYFLIVWDIVKYAKKQNILVGPGRGSAPGSLVAYVLGITNIDPIKYELLFERFLNPERVDMPDIDLDFPDNCRDVVVKYVYEKYGANNVAQIVTYNKYLIKNAIRDIARVEKIDLQVVNQFVKFFPGINPDVNKIINTDTDLKEFLLTNPMCQKVLKVALRFMGLIRHTSVHAAGVIISSNALNEYVGTINHGHDVPVTQFDMIDLASIGLLKFDFLSIRNLTLLKAMEDEIKKENTNFNISKVSLDNELVYKYLTDGCSYGVFQLESSGIRKAMKSVKVSNFNDLVMMLALYRPGPSQNIYKVANRKNGKEQIVYSDEALKPILEKTYGIMIYQEQVMQIFQTVGGYSLGQADILRRAISKKMKNIILAEGNNFINEAVKKGYKETVAKSLYNNIVRFADYGFNLSHAVSYALISYQMMYVKANYPKIFFSVILNYTSFNQKVYDEWKEDLKKFKVKIFPPKVNECEINFSIKEKGLMMGLSHISDITDELARKIIAEQKKEEFKDVEDFIKRMVKDINEEQYKMLVYAGYFDAFNNNYNELISKYSKTQGFLKYNPINDQEVVVVSNEKVEDMNKDQKDKLKLVALKVNLQ